MDPFWSPLGKLHGAVFEGFGRPKMQDLGSQNVDPKGADCKQAIFEKSKEQPSFFKYVNALRGSNFQ